MRTGVRSEVGCPSVLCILDSLRQREGKRKFARAASLNLRDASIGNFRAMMSVNTNCIYIH